MTSFSDLFDGPNCTEPVELVPAKFKSITVFDYLSDICYDKKGDIHIERDFDMKGWNTFMILRYLSMDTGYLPFINIFNQYQSIMSPRQMYRTLIHLIPKQKKFLKYPKINKVDISEDDIDLVCRYYGCSKVESTEYFSMGFISKRDVDIIREKFGGRL